MVLTKKLSVLVDCASSIHRRKILKVTASLEKVNIKVYKETSKYMWQHYANFHIIYSLPLEQYFAAVI